MDEYEFHIQDWLSRFPFDSFRPDLRHVSWHGPGHFCFRELWCRKAAAKFDLGNTVPTDAFVLAYGEAPRRDMTKFAGLPFRPAGIPWPRSSESGVPLTMVAQFRFSESRDIMPDLPGDVLLCFFEESYGAGYDEFAGPPVFEWYPLAIRDLVGPDEIPTPGFELPPPCYGLRFRTVDYSDSVAIDALKAVLPRHLYDRYFCDDDDDMVVSEARQWQLKIGGLPYWEDLDEVKQENIEPGAFLASIPTVRGGSEEPFPWANKESEVWENSFSWAESGIVHLFLDDVGNVQPRIQS